MGRDWEPSEDAPGYTRPLPHAMRPRGRGYEPDGHPGIRYRHGRRGRRILKRLAVTVVIVAVIAGLGIGALWVATPSASDATTLAADQARQHGIAYPGPHVPATFSNALIATEDHRFYSEQGVDPVAVIRAIQSRITGDFTDQGGATIEQQLAKMLYTPGQGGVTAELKQVIMAYKLDGAYSKSQILDLYAEVAYYGHGYYGLEAASCGYFGHPAADLTPVQGAMLAGAVNAPSIDDPINDPQRAQARLDHVISRMQTVGDITAAQAAQMTHTSLGIVPRSQAGC